MYRQTGKGALTRDAILQVLDCYGDRLTREQIARFGKLSYEQVRNQTLNLSVEGLIISSIEGGQRFYSLKNRIEAAPPGVWIEKYTVSRFRKSGKVTRYTYYRLCSNKKQIHLGSENSKAFMDAQKAIAKRDERRQQLLTFRATGEYQLSLF